ncbi:hypothetical protein EOI86_22470 [Hwanghaeella grinnelliae]|uniref:histidine kinase n=1 Tax=Hwanghaeella grinnelliae TaxID=2500179 RepID=A0A3S2Z4W9_9PROT|nr:ATP-binding protein [Hwanghaeella grinnelliae]RVU33899.1 hypothetical protein EOI86_22470 [Hwanghaeella grinnelliae]
MTQESPDRGSLLAAVFWRVGLTMLLAIGLVSGLLLYEFTDHIDNMRDRSLKGQAMDIVRHLTVSDGQTVNLDLPPSLAAAYQIPDDMPRFAILDESGKVLAASPNVSEPLWNGIAAKGPLPQTFETHDPESGDLVYGVSLRPEELGRSITIQVTQNASHHDVLADTLLDEAVDEYLWVIVLIFAAILAVTYVTLRSALAPLSEASAQAAAIGPSSLERRLRTDRLPREILPLVTAVNSALDRVEKGFQVQRRFTADAAHEMRTPIALLRTHLENLDPTRAAALREDLNQLERVVAQLLKLAQVDALVVPEGSRADLCEVATNAAAFLGPKAVAAGKSLALEGNDRVTVAGDPDALEVAIRNLVENALVQTPTEEEVVIRITEDPPCIQILDRGPGISDDDREHLFDRFWRKERNLDTGAGLGLSIVSRIAAAHGATLDIDRRPGGGTVFAMTFPGPAMPESTRADA